MQYFWAVIFSLILHFLIVSFLDKLPDDRKVNLPIEVVLPETSPDKTAKTLVRETNDKEQKLADEKKKARFLSEKMKRFKEETRVRNSGMTQNLGGGGAKPLVLPKPPTMEGPGTVAKQFAPANPWANVGSGRPGQRSASGEKLPEDVKFGEFNALNTDRYLYYTFFARIEERIRPRWEMSVKDVIGQTHPSIMRKEWLTQIEILLDREGKFERVILHKKSGMEGLDLAAINAFKAGSPYQNPPQEMVQDDGHIHLYYSILVSPYL